MKKLQKIEDENTILSVGFFLGAISAILLNGITLVIIWFLMSRYVG